jgi:16S rRNA (cytidine1402-2'-O)-methyltransferase
MKGKLFLIPTIIAEGTAEGVIPKQVLQTLAGIDTFLAEEVRTARRYLSSLKIYPSIEALQFHVLDKKSREADIRPLLLPILEGRSMGVLSESGCPGVADPGALAVKLAHELNIPVVPLVGPSSILLSLMASGLNGQCFAFRGYLPIDGKEAARAIQDLEKESRTRNQTQIAIETPYRNKTLFQNLIRTLNDTTMLTVATDVTGAEERIKTIPVRQWKKESPELPKLPTVFLFLAS